MVPTGARIRMCESIAKLAKARKSKIAQDDTDHDPSNGRFTSGSGGSAKPAKKSDASNPDHKWGSWKEFNDDYTKALQKRNAAAREHDKATRTGQESPKTAAKLERAKAFADAHSDHPNRPSSSVTYNFNRPRIGQDSAVCRLARARRPKIAQDADWDEGKHKRAGNGQFGSGGGGGVNVKHAEQRLAARETQRKQDVSMGKARQDANGAARAEAAKKAGQNKPAFVPGGHVKASSPQDHSSASEWHRQKASEHETHARTLIGRAKDMRKEGDHGEANFLSREAQMHRDASMNHSSAAMLHKTASTNLQHSDKANEASSRAIQKSKNFAPGSYTARELNK